MSIPLFDEVEPLSGCVCEECARQRLADSVTRAAGTAGTTTPAAARVVIVAAAAGTAISGGAGTVVAAAFPHAATGSTPGHAMFPAQAAAPAAPLRLTRDQILDRAQRWVDAVVPYSMTAYWKDGYRQDCSGYISMAWGLGTSEWTGSLPDFATRISRADLMPGDILLFHNQADPEQGSHAVIFAGWADSAHTEYTAMEQTQPHTRVQTTPLAYWTNSGKYLAYRYKYLVATAGPAPGPGTGGTGTGTGSAGTGAGTAGTDAYPGASAFGPGAKNASVTRLGTMLAARGARSYYTVGPGSLWTDADLGATSAFQRAQGWSGGDADGLPGPTTWGYLVEGKGKDIGAAAAKPPARVSTETGYPGAGFFRAGQSNDYVLNLGRRLVAKGFGKNYRVGPSRTWGEADRRAVEAFQRAQGWSGRDADGYPGPETWRRLFS
ncbi:peptidoglycan-binding protein [Streptomyces sp. H10-C2]|uniref:peptidoglycan-binding protein n=1 Tax=unclassified Streptomyces TaxID=2593676 RepID=UPI0024BA14A1|nr:MULTISPECIES: peptidoglycan-binding protein [unclassified Streptomyces]MDJ0344677.1 peptidoglycan-binding protein [Streptomyces sp. PH10-H1]MDJ0372839.1 peptidoglycan-binding protein [Streptomyces sp. H10-C2]